ncbi:uncharacterized protein LOC132746567 [Ruditapes philippinarum]|uniref:uncharacterized protein LOC132746567 n=1 Tax=Ruditapes philippinarum TaxID=129788 RepID=UPI00295B6040|nr:uncharacterized protein LOC132746567 [Ruditapes philippinarum]
MSLQQDIEKTGYRNWVKGGLAYKYLRRGIADFIDDAVKKEHERILSTIKHKPGTTCSSCCLRNLRPLHACKKNHIGKNKCPFDIKGCGCFCPKNTFPCPAKICDAIHTEIINCHGSMPPDPNWKNTDIHKWCTSPWEIGKCYIKAPGYSKLTKAADIDIAGLLHVLINNISLKSHLSDTLNSSGMLEKTLHGRNNLCHSANMELDESELNDIIDDMIRILEDSEELGARCDAKEAIANLNQLKEKTFIITTNDEAEVFKQSFNILSEKCEELTRTIQEAKDDIGASGAKQIETIKDTTRTVVQDFLKEEREKTDKILYDRVERLESRLTAIETEFHKFENLRVKHRNQLDFVQAKLALQKRLVHLYQTHYIKTSISPLKSQENDLNIEDMYVFPNMTMEDKKKGDKTHNLHRTRDSQNISRPVSHYRDILQTNDKKHRNIYIVGNVGTGKSAFCKMMIQNWCLGILVNERQRSGNSPNIHQQDKKDGSVDDEIMYENCSLKTVDKNESMPSDEYDSSENGETIPSIGMHVEGDYNEVFSKTNIENMKEIKQFEFLFFVPLERMSGYGSFIDMIKSFATSTDLSTSEIIDRIFATESERCLVIADSLDEWIPPEPKGLLPHESYGLPSRNQLHAARIITLSRPSAKGIINMKSSECDQRIDLLGINVKHMKMFVRKYLAQNDQTDQSCKSFLDKIRLSEIEKLENNPLLLQQLVWLFCMENDIGRSSTDIYSHLLNIMLAWSEDKTGDACLQDMPLTDTTVLPDLLHRFPRCEENKQFLLQIGSVAFKLLVESRTSTFSRVFLKENGLSTKSIQKVINLGIVVEEKCFNPTRERTTLIFIHKSYLEFFAALYLVSQCHRVHNTASGMNQSKTTAKVFHDLLKDFESVAAILQLSNVLKMVCGMSPGSIKDITEVICYIASIDDDMIRDRDSRFEDSYCTLIYQFEHLISDCLQEGDLNEQVMIHMCDVTVDYDTNINTLHHIVKDSVISFWNFEYFDLELFRWVLGLTRLQYIDADLDELPHDCMEQLSSFIHTSPLKVIRLSDLTCTMKKCEGHMLDLGRHNDLKKLDIDCHNVIISNINTENLKCLHVNPHSILHFSMLLNARCLTELDLSSVHENRFLFTREINSVLHTLHQLEKLMLSYVDIASRSITVDSSMKNLEVIGFYWVHMNIETVQMFVDSLCDLQNIVHVTFNGSEVDEDAYINISKRKKMLVTRMPWGDIYTRNTVT